MEEDKPAIVKCYQCGIGIAVGGSGLFPFCSLSCKQIYSAAHPIKCSGPRYKTVEECQKRLMEMKIENEIRKKQSNDLYEQAKTIFG